MVFYECIALCPPHTLELGTNPKKALDFDDCDDDDEDDEEDVLDFMVGTRPVFREGTKFLSCYDDILQVFHICTDDHPEKRPDAKKLESIFKEFKKV